jgi:hypothetical protein
VVHALAERVGTFFVGPGKCGTSWVFEACRSHPGVNVGRIKEPGEFLRDSPDIAAYERLWQGPGVRCDFSNTYFFSETAAEGIRRYNPAARICITVREPLSRLVSQYMFMRRNGRFDGPIGDAVVAHPEIVDRCRYASHGARWLARFPGAQLLVLQLETLRADPVRYRQALFGFLGVPDRDAAVRVEPAQAAALPRSRWVARGTKELADLARGARLFRLLDWAKRSGIARMLYRPLPGSYQREHLDAIPAGVRRELEEQYAEFVGLASRQPGLQIV